MRRSSFIKSKGIFLVKSPSFFVFSPPFFFFLWGCVSDLYIYVKITVTVNVGIHPKPTSVWSFVVMVVL